MKEIKAPNLRYHIDGNTTIFLAGSIELGKAIPWQTDLVKEFKDDNITFFNPRREDWDSSWTQEITDPQFYEQVGWELDSLEEADIIIYCFDPETKSPITLLELGLFARSDKPIIVYCPEGFWRKGNVDFICERFVLFKVDSWNELLATLRGFIDPNSRTNI